jgi:hypothetical protein
MVTWSLSIVLFLVFLDQAALAEPIYKWKVDNGQRHFSDVLPTGVTGKTAVEGPLSDSRTPHAQPTPSGGNEREDKSAASPRQRWLLIFPPTAQVGTGDTKRFSRWTPAQFFESEETCNHYKAIVIVNSVRLSDGVSSLNSPLLNSNCIPASEFITGKEADVIVAATRFEPVAVGFSSHLLYGKVFNRGQATARNVVTKYKIRDSNGSIIMQGEIPTSPGDIPGLTFSEFRTPSIGGWSLYGLSVQADADWLKK